MNYNRIKEWMGKRKKTTTELAAYMNKSRQSVSGWRSNTNQPEIPTLYRIADFLNVEVADLLTEKKNLKELPIKANVPKKTTKKK